MNKLTITKWVEEFDNGSFNSPDFYTQVEAGWYDWFCKDSSLKNKTIKLADKLKSVLKANKTGQKFDPEKTYVFFKNNCPLNGSLYDDFRICDIETGNVIYTITPSSGHKPIFGVSELWGRENEFDCPIIEGKWEDILNYFRRK